MTSDQRLSKLRNATVASSASSVPAASDSPAPGGKQPLSLDTVLHKTPNVERSSDPYNTSGSFDRKKNWAKIGKR
jgi:hypothetical protein